MRPVTHVDRDAIVATLQARGLQDRADWVERSLPPLVDIRENRALLQMLNIDTGAL